MTENPPLKRWGPTATVSMDFWSYFMTTTTDRLLALACAFLAKDPSPNARSQEILDWAEVRQKLAMGEQKAAPVEPQSCPRCNGLGAIHIHYSEDGKRQCDPCPVCKPKAEPQHSATIEEARYKAHCAFGEAWSGMGYGRALSAALDAFIAAMPQPHVHDWHERGDEVGGMFCRSCGEEIDIATGQDSDDEPSPDPQPEKVPDEVMSAAFEAAVKANRIGCSGIQESATVIWNAAGRFGPMPPKVTEEMIDAAVAASWDFCGSTEMRAVIREELEAALAASPTQQQRGE